MLSTKRKALIGIFGSINNDIFLESDAWLFFEVNLASEPDLKGKSQSNIGKEIWHCL